MAFFCSINKHILVIKKSDYWTERACQTHWNLAQSSDQMVLTVTFLKNVRLSGFCGSAQCHREVLLFGFKSSHCFQRWEYTVYILADLMDGKISLAAQAFNAKCVSSFYHIIEGYLIDTRVDLACLLPHTRNCIMDELIMKCAQIF